MTKFNNAKNKTNKKVLLRECKRHTARCVVSTPFVVLTGYPQQGTPLQQGTPQQGTPPAGYPPSWTWPGTPPCVCPMEFWVMLQSIMGYGYPPVDRQIDGWMDRHVSKHYLPVVLRTWAVIIRE